MITTGVFSTQREAEAHRRELDLGPEWERYRVPAPRSNPPARPRSRKKKGRRHSNPAGLRLIYPHLRNIVAQKGPGEHLNCDPACKRANHVYEHVFSSEPPIYGTERAGLFYLPKNSLVVPA